MSEYEPITAELRRAMDVDREFMRADGAVVAQTFCIDRGDFDRLCDAIDAVHAGLERENAELRERVAELDESVESMHETDAWKLGYDEGFASADDWMADNEDAMAEHGWVRGPLGKDGKLWRSGDMSDSNWGEIWGIAYENGKWFIRGHDTSAPWIPADSIGHYHTPTVEDVLREFANEVYADADNEIRDRDFLCAKYAKRLTLVGDAS